MRRTRRLVERPKAGDGTVPPCHWPGGDTQWCEHAWLLQKWDSNCAPRSVTTVSGMSKREIQPDMKARATASAVILESGITSGHCVNRSTHVRRWVNPRDWGSGPTKSMCTMWNQKSGSGNVARGDLVCRWTLVRWHCKQLRAQRRTSALISGHT